jgi:hypothetical protein
VSDPVDLSEAAVLFATNTHLYRGARLVSRDAAVVPLRPVALRLVFSDGIQADAELLQSSDGTAFAVDVPAYRTAAGQDIAAKVWRIARIEPATATETPAATEASAIVIGEREA